MNPNLSPPTTKAVPLPEFLRAGPMAQAMGVRKTYFYELVKRPGFPAPSRLSSRCALYPRVKVLAWLAAQTTAEAA